MKMHCILSCGEHHVYFLSLKFCHPPTSYQISIYFPHLQLGLHVMDKKIQDLTSSDPLSASDQMPHTVLGVQRARIEQLSLSGGNVGQYTMTGPGSPSGPAATGAALGILSSNNTAHTTPVKH
jgi:hypothetical protein